MTKITVYDIDAEIIKKIAEDNDTSIAEVVYMLLDYADEMKQDNKLN